jgi:hypothetical protein
MYPWQIQHIPFSCKQGEAALVLPSVISSDSLRSRPDDVHCSAPLGVTSSALPGPETDASLTHAPPAFCHVLKGLSLYALR